MGVTQLIVVGCGGKVTSFWGLNNEIYYVFFLVANRSEFNLESVGKVQPSAKEFNMTRNTPPRQNTSSTYFCFTFEHVTGQF